MGCIIKLQSVDDPQRHCTHFFHDFPLCITFNINNCDLFVIWRTYTQIDRLRLINRHKHRWRANAVYVTRDGWPQIKKKKNRKPSFSAFINYYSPLNQCVPSFIPSVPALLQDPNHTHHASLAIQTQRASACDSRMDSNSSVFVVCRLTPHRCLDRPGSLGFERESG